MISWLKGKRTLLIGTAISVLALFDEYAREIVPDDLQGWFLFGSGLLMIGLRLVTSTPVGRSDAG